MNDVESSHSRTGAHIPKRYASKKKGEPRVRKFEINYTHQGEVLANDSTQLAHGLTQILLAANKDETSHSLSIRHSRKRQHSRDMVVANEDYISHLQAISHPRKQWHSCNMAMENEQVNLHLRTSLGLRKNLHSPLKSQGLTTVHITLTRVRTMLRDQIKQQIINQDEVFRPPNNKGN